MKKNDFKITFFFKDNKYAFISAGGTALIMLLVYVANAVYPLGPNSVLCVDLYQQYAPLYSELWDRIMDGGSFLYSWNSGGGMPWLGNFFNYLSSPFSFLVCLFPKENVIEAITLIILLKSSLASFTFSCFIKRKTVNKSYLVSGFGVLYSCSGWFIAYFWDLMWLDAFYLLPLVALGIEKLIDFKKSALYIITLAITFITNYYMAYMLCIFSVLYFLYYFFCQNNNVFKFSEKLSVKEIKNNLFINRGLDFAFSSVGAVLLSAFAILPVFLILQSSSATGDKFPDKFITSFNIFDFIVQHFTAIEPTIYYVGEETYLPNVACGVLSIMLLPLFFFVKKISKREKVLSAAFLLFMLASFYVIYLDFIWNGFHLPNDLPFRYSYMYSFVLLIVAFRTIEHIKEIPQKYIKITAISFAVFLIVVQKIGSKNFDELTFWVSLVFVVVYYFGLLLLSSEKQPQRVVALLLLLLVCTEYTIGNCKKYSMEFPREDYTYDYASFDEIEQKLKETETDEFYRLEMLKERPLMSPSWYGYQGISFFTSMASEKNANMHNLLGLKSNGINSAIYHGQTPVYDAFFGIKYVLNSPLSCPYELSQEYYESCNINSLYFYTYKNKYPLSLGFAVNDGVEKYSITEKKPFENQEKLFESSTGVKNIFDYAEIVSVKTQNIEIDKEAFLKGDLSNFSVTSPADATIKVKLKAEQTGEFYAYVFAEKYDLLRVITYKAEKQSITHSVDCGSQIVCIGTVEKDEVIDVDITMPYFEDDELAESEISVTGAVVNKEQFEKGYNKLKKSQLEITTFEEDYFSGIINMPKDSILYTSVPYDKGWDITVDGKESNDKIIVIADNLMGVSLDEGEHTVEFTYSAPGLKEGAIISLTTAIVLFVAFIFKRKKNKLK